MGVLSQQFNQAPSQGSISVNIENFSGSNDELTKLEDMLLRLQSNGRIRGVFA